MNKQEFVDLIATKSELTKVQATKALDAVLDGIKETLSSGGDVRLTGFGTFASVHRDARKGRVPGTDRIIDIAAKNVPQFKAGKELKEAVKA